jgi:cytochrome P450
MTVACFNVCSNPDIYKKLTDELMATFPDDSDRLDFLTLEKLPYLTAVIKEGLRLSFGVIGRLPRLVPDPGATFNGFYIPAGCIVGMSSWVMHRNEDVFPDAMKFDPDRWLDPEHARFLDKHMVPFGKGTRQCVGEYLSSWLFKCVELNLLKRNAPGILRAVLFAWSLLPPFPVPNVTGVQHNKGGHGV